VHIPKGGTGNDTGNFHREWSPLISISSDLDDSLRLSHVSIEIVSKNQSVKRRIEKSGNSTIVLRLACVEAVPIATLVPSGGIS
jgi:hypothetical protein